MVNPRRIQHTLNGNHVRKLVSTRDAILVDVRNPLAIRDTPIPGSKRMTLRQLSALQTEDKSKPVVVIQDEADPSTTNTAVKYITLYGFPDVYVMSANDW